MNKQKSRNLKRILGMATAVMLIAVSLFPMSALAATHDTIEDVSTSTATLTLGKELSYTNRQHSPVSSVTYTIEKVEAWGNENAANGTNGTAIPVASMPNPSSSSVNIPLTDNTSTHVASGTANVTIPFTQAGYYVYKIKETPISSITGATVTSDTHEYFAVIYVCNKTDANGNTISGVYVHDITSYRNTSGSSTYRPNLTDISTTTDNSGTAAQTNNSTNLGKVGKSTSSDPDALAAYKMWNAVAYPAPVDLTTSNNVTGSLGDRTKNFSFAVSLTGLEPNSSYTVNTTGTVTMTSGKGTYSNGTITTNANGEAVFTLLMSDDKSFKINDVPVGTTWSITEAANNHKASVSVTPKTSVSGQTGTGTYTKANDAPNTALAVGGTLSADTTVPFVNDRNIAIMTGVPAEFTGVLYGVAICGALLAVLLLVAAVKRNHDDEDYIESCKAECR